MSNERTHEPKRSPSTSKCWLAEKRFANPNVGDVAVPDNVWTTRLKASLDEVRERCRSSVTKRRAHTRPASTNPVNTVFRHDFGHPSTRNRATGLDQMVMDFDGTISSVRPGVNSPDRVDELGLSGDTFGFDSVAFG